MSTDPSPVTLRPLTPEEFPAWRAASVAMYAEAIAISKDLTPAQAAERSDRVYDDLLPDGVATEHNLIWMAVDDGRPVGSLWICTKSSAASTSAAFVFNVRVDEDQRGRGYGRSIMRAAEDECRARGIARLELNVFGDNRIAIGLYDSLGYQLISQQMRKDL